MINIAIIEDNLELRKALSDYFAQSTRVECVIAVDTVEKFIKFHRDFLQIQLILLDVCLYEQSGIQGIPLIRQREPKPKSSCLQSWMITIPSLKRSATVQQDTC